MMKETRSQTTYEELKLETVIHEILDVFCSQTTYEELKHPTSEHPAYFGKAPRLPMRN